VSCCRWCATRRAGSPRSPSSYGSAGGGHDGEGEDIKWDQFDQIEFLRGGDQLTWLRGARTFDEFSTLLGLANLFPVEPIRDSARFYRRWAFESAALDLALRQSGVSL
jgi:hypothetical protein